MVKRGRENDNRRPRQTSGAGRPISLRLDFNMLYFHDIISIFRSARPLHHLPKTRPDRRLFAVAPSMNMMNAPRRHPLAALRIVLALLAGLALAASPRELLSMRPPAAPAAPGLAAVPFPFPKSLAAPADSGATTARNAVRLPVSPHAVRLAVDKTALHPQDHPLPVRRQARLPGAAPGIRAERVFAVNEPDLPPAAPPAFPAAQAAAPASVSVPGPASGAARPASVAPTGVAAAQAAIPVPSRPAPPGVSGRGSLLVVGDSLSISLADVLERRLARIPGLAFARLGKVSSGLARPEFFDWEKNMAEMAAKSHPDVVVIMIGANDNKSLRLDSGRTVHFGSPGWAVEYRRRAARLVEIARSNNPAARIVWLGAPVMADPSLARDMPAINAALAEEMRRLPGCRFVDVWPVLAGPNGGFAEFLDARTRLRAKDGVHLAPAGAARLADACLAALAEPAAGVMLSQLP
jgi:hypothetical protein